MRFSRRSLLVAAALTALLAANDARGQGTAPAARDTSALRVLFIGNSYTYFNDLPSVVGDLSRAAGERRAFVAEQVTFGGHTIEMHLARPEALRAVRRGGWSVVVLQEQSTRPIDAAALTVRDVPRIAEEARRVGARLALYLTWAREARPASQDTLTGTYTAAARASDATVVAVGEAWRAARGDLAVSDALRGAKTSLFDSDGSHPSPIGTYLTACVVYASLYGRSPVGLPPITRRTTAEPLPGLPAGAPRDTIPLHLARELQRVAWAVVSRPRASLRDR
ncbi:MAG: hypothetical protein ACT4P7_02810 [Gemmatimonadaceae bacterium]